jgi:hypothetical protein
LVIEATTASKIQIITCMYSNNVNKDNNRC